MKDEDGLSVAQMAEATGVTAHTLRYYERAGLIRPVARNSGNHRRYSAVDVEWVRFLLRLRQTHMPIAQMQDYAALREQGPTTTARRLRLLEAHHAELREQIARLQTHEQALVEKIAVYRRGLASPTANEPTGVDAR
ncbi:MerR family transcriptional regulator [Microbacterium sp. CFBP 8794]|uniref:MerR family transcriptional regulator n=1 Tax=Microbacterium sp. CFBP 8794 TaxID=2775269 RepID=UPI001786F8C6|nr:MerR family transcriptional regulator [Microbacterium sp. CFBP 8794]MBD8478348.1 MerR family transcriptional regulator [Microbacterium sp. CFBP 8794]